MPMLWIFYSYCCNDPNSHYNCTWELVHTTVFFSANSTPVVDAHQQKNIGPPPSSINNNNNVPVSSRRPILLDLHSVTNHRRRLFFSHEVPFLGNDIAQSFEGGCAGGGHEHDSDGHSTSSHHRQRRGAHGRSNITTSPEESTPD